MVSDEGGKNKLAVRNCSLKWVISNEPHVLTLLNMLTHAPIVNGWTSPKCRLRRTRFWRAVSNDWLQLTWNSLVVFSLEKLRGQQLHFASCSHDDHKHAVLRRATQLQQNTFFLNLFRLNEFGLKIRTLDFLHGMRWYEMNMSGTAPRPPTTCCASRILPGMISLKWFTGGQVGIHCSKGSGNR